MKSKRQNRPLPNWCIAALVALSLAVIGLAMALLLKPVVVVSNYEQCKQAGGAIMESSPEQCQINGTTFVNTSQSTLRSEKTYVGLSEKDALASAKQDGVPARVVERDGESLPADMSFVSGRVSLYVKDGNVYRVTVEGELQDQ